MILTNERALSLEECSRPDTNGVSLKCRDLVPGRVFSMRYIIGYNCKAITLQVGEALAYYTNKNGGRCLSNR